MTHETRARFVRRTNHGPLLLCSTRHDRAVLTDESSKTWGTKERDLQRTSGGDEMDTWPAEDDVEAWARAYEIEALLRHMAFRSDIWKIFRVR